MTKAARPRKVSPKKFGDPADSTVTIYDQNQPPVDYSKLKQGLNPKYQLGEWVPPQPASLSALPQGARLPLTLVLNFLAFETTSPPPEPPMSKPGPNLKPEEVEEHERLHRIKHRLMCEAHWRRAFAKLCSAASDGKVKLFGTRCLGGRRQAIDPTEFDVPLSLADEDGAIGLDLEAVAAASMERYVKERQKDSSLFYDVTVDRASLAQWLDKMPAVTRRKVKANKVTACRQWLVGLRKSGPPSKMKAEYAAEAKQRFDVGPDQFRKSWALAAIDQASDDWESQAVRQRKSSGNNHPAE